VGNRRIDRLIPSPVSGNAKSRHRIRSMEAWASPGRCLRLQPRAVYAFSGISVKDQKSHLFGIEAAEPSRFPQLLIGGQKDTSLWGVFAPS